MKPLLKEERGVFTFEATLVFPAFLIFVLAGVFFCIIIFQMGSAHYVAQKAASHVAYTWDNSHKDLETGEFDKQYYTGLGNDGEDGLYWRIFNNGVLEMFGLEELFDAENGGLKGRKIRKASSKYSNPLKVTVQYNNSIIYSEVSVTAESELYLPAFLKNMLGGTSNILEANSSHVVTETPELIRTFNFSKYLWNASGLGSVANEITESIGDFFHES